MTHRELPRWKKVTYGILAALVLAAIIAGILYLRDRQPEPVPTPTPAPESTETPRGLSNERFGQRARPLATANVDVGVLTVRIREQTPEPSPAGRTDLRNRLGPVAQLAPPESIQYPSPAATAESESLRSVPTALPSATPAPEPLPSFEPLPDAPAPETREFAVAYAKGDIGKRQIYLRSVERDRDDQLVSSVFDDYGVAFSSATQKIAFYSNEEGASDETRNRSKLKVVDIATREVATIASNLPGTWPAAWSPDGKRLAIPAERSIFVADTTSGDVQRVATPEGPGGLVWAPDGVTLYFQIEVAEGNHDIHVANAITGGTKAVVNTPRNEYDASLSLDGSRLNFLRAQDRGGALLVIRTLENDEEQSFTQTQPTHSYLLNRESDATVLVRGSKPALALFKDGTVKTFGSLKNPVLAGWDRDYGHVLVIADDDRGRALFSVELGSGDTQKLKAGVSDTVPVSRR